MYLAQMGLNLALSPGHLVCREGPRNHCMRTHQLYHENLVLRTQAFSAKELAWVHGYSMLSLVLRPSLSW